MQELEHTRDRALHERYAIEAVPATLVVDGDGVVVASFIGPVTATDLWAAVAEAREPGTTPPRVPPALSGCGGYGRRRRSRASRRCWRAPARRR